MPPLPPPNDSSSARARTASVQNANDPVFGDALRPAVRAKVEAILTAADRLLRTNPHATLEEIAVAASVSRTTVYRRFPSRAGLSIALSRWALARLVNALACAGIDQAPAYVALYQAVRNALDVKVSLAYARDLPQPDDAIVRNYQGQLRRLADALILQCQREGVMRQDVPVAWVRAVLTALIHEATATEREPPNLAAPPTEPAHTSPASKGELPASSADAVAAADHPIDTAGLECRARLVVDTLLRGLGPST